MPNTVEQSTNPDVISKTSKKVLNVGSPTALIAPKNSAYCSQLKRDRLSKYPHYFQICCTPQKDEERQEENTIARIF